VKEKLISFENKDTILVSYSMRGEELVVNEALKVRALPEGVAMASKMWGLRGGPERPQAR
jgi:hypothetical protein